MGNVIMHLIKDFDLEEGKSIYYFEVDGEQISKAMTTYNELSEWWLKYHRVENPFGIERRQSHLDRRGARGQDTFERILTGSTTTSFGRRRTDMQIRITENRSKDKIAALRAAFSKLSTADSKDNHILSS